MRNAHGLQQCSTVWADHCWVYLGCWVDIIWNHASGMHDHLQSVGTGCRHAGGVITLECSKVSAITSMCSAGILTEKFVSLCCCYMPVTACIIFVERKGNIDTMCRSANLIRPDTWPCICNAWGHSGMASRKGCTFLGLAKPPATDGFSAHVYGNRCCRGTACLNTALRCCTPRTGTQRH